MLYVKAAWFRRRKSFVHDIQNIFTEVIIPEKSGKELTKVCQIDHQNKHYVYTLHNQY
jgi:hypothetical protein